MSNIAAGKECVERCSRRAKGEEVTPHTWERFMEALDRNGFFEGEMKGSERYREKVAMAQVTDDRNAHALLKS